MPDVAFLDHLVLLHIPPEGIAMDHLARGPLFVISEPIDPFIIEYYLESGLESAFKLGVQDSQLIEIAVLDVEVAQTVTPWTLVTHLLTFWLLGNNLLSDIVDNKLMEFL